MSSIIQVVLPKDLHDRILAHSKEEDRSISGVVRNIVTNYFRQKDNDNKKGE